MNKDVQDSIRYGRQVLKDCLYLSTSAMSFTVRGLPQGKARARTFTAPNGKIRTITPEKTRAYEDYVKMAYVQANGQFYEDKCLFVGIVAFYPIPKSYTKSKRGLIAKGRLFPTVKPDCDNIAKIILDALNGVAYYDDKQVCHLTVKKWYTEEEPKVRVYIEEL